jgi:hypothetical protein
MGGVGSRCWDDVGDGRNEEGRWGENGKERRGEEESGKRAVRERELEMGK